jgi:hypothetical protein
MCKMFQLIPSCIRASNMMQLPGRLIWAEGVLEEHDSGFMELMASLQCVLFRTRQEYCVLFLMPILSVYC